MSKMTPEERNERRDDIAALAARYPAIRQRLPLALNTRERTPEIVKATGLTPQRIQTALKFVAGGAT